jgi:GT2 family glycosyltransferase
VVPRTATIQILNWDGKHLLAECLPSVIEAVHASGGNHEILVVDNGSRDGSVEFIRDRFPEIHTLELDRNYGFVGGNNRGVHIAKTDVVVFLNNDMIVDRDFLQPLLEGFTDDSVFAVTSQIFFEDSSRRREETGNTRGKFENGFFTIWHEDIGSDENWPVIPVLWAGGGSCAFDRIKYLELAGLDDLYHPFYVEDLDLSYRAWKCGWKCLLAPASRVIHKHRATSSRKYTHRFVDETIRRNLFLFTWKNVSDRSMLLEHILNLPRIHGRGMMATGCGAELRAYIRACIKFPFSAWRRFRQHENRWSDCDVLARSRP